MGTGRGIRRRDIAQQQPVSDEDGKGHDPLPGTLQAQIQHGGEHPGQADASQHAGVAEGLELEVEESLVDQFQKDQHQAPADHRPPDPATGKALLLLGGKRKGEGHPGDEKENRENGIVLPQPFPGNMVHLEGDPAFIAAGEEGADGENEGRQAHDKEHVEAPQGIQGIKSLICHNYRVNTCPA